MILTISLLMPDVTLKDASQYLNPWQATGSKPIAVMTILVFSVIDDMQMATIHFLEPEHRTLASTWEKPADLLVSNVRW